MQQHRSGEDILFRLRHANPPAGTHAQPPSITVPPGKEPPRLRQRQGVVLPNRNLSTRVNKSLRLPTFFAPIGDPRIGIGYNIPGMVHAKGSPLFHEGLRKAYHMYNVTTSWGKAFSASKTGVAAQGNEPVAESGSTEKKTACQVLRMLCCKVYKNCSRPIVFGRMYQLHQLAWKSRGGWRVLNPVFSR